MKYQQRKSSKEVRRGDVVVYNDSNTLVLVLGVFDVTEETKRVTHREKYVGFIENKIRFEEGDYFCVESILNNNAYCGKAPK